MLLAMKQSAMTKSVLKLNTKIKRFIEDKNLLLQVLQEFFITFRYGFLCVLSLLGNRENAYVLNSMADTAVKMLIFLRFFVAVEWHSSTYGQQLL